MIQDYTDAALREISPLQASKIFNQAFQEMSKDNSDAVACWRDCRDALPKLFAHAQAAMPAQAATASLANDNAAPDAFALHLPMMSLPMDTTRDEFKICWMANGNRVTPCQPQKMVDALQGLYMSQGMAEAGAKAEVANKFSKLVAAAKAAGQ